MHIYISVSVVIKTYSTHPVSVTRSARPGYGRSSRKSGPDTTPYPEPHIPITASLCLAEEMHSPSP
jgi:hypothetical protein